MNEIKENTLSLCNKMKEANSIAILDQLKAEAFGKTGFISTAMSQLKSMSVEQKKRLGLLLIIVKNNCKKL